MALKYYAVVDETNKLIYTSWEEVLKILPKLVKPKYKSFSTREEAEAYLTGKVFQEEIDAPCAYIDGSYDKDTEEYSFGGVLLYQQSIYQFKKKYPKDEFSAMRNVAGEIKGAGFIIQYAIRHHISELHIFYDYMGIEKWFTKEWQAKSPIGIEYVKFCDTIRDKIKITFHKVKSHTNNYYNELADRLAKEALK